MMVLVSGYPGISVDKIVSKVGRSDVNASNLFFSLYDGKEKKRSVMEKFPPSNVTFVLLTCDANTARNNGVGPKKEFKKIINYFNWAFSLFPGVKRKIDISVVGEKGAVSKIKKLFDEE